MASFQFKKVDLKSYQKNTVPLTCDDIYWKQLEAPVLVKEFGAIDYIDFSPVEPHYFAVTCSVRVQVYNPITRQVTKNLSRFREGAYGGSFRSDGKLIVAGGEESVVRLFDVQTKSLLRLFSGHKGPVHRTFFTQKQTTLASFSDDKTVCVWDIASEDKLATFAEHTDYVRAGAVSPVSPDVLISGGYDGTVKMYDIRTGKSVFSINHGSPVESTIFMPTGGLLLSCGGTEIKVWDAFMGGKLLASISQHHKTVTCLHLASHNKRLLSGSLDRHVKIYDLTTFKVVHTLDYPNAILSLGIPENDETLVVGMVDGLISIRRRDEHTNISENKPFEEKASVVPTYIDEVIPQNIVEKQSRYDALLRKFQYSKALDVVMGTYISTKTPDITVTLFQELIRRRALHTALAGRDEKSLCSILKFIFRNIGDGRFTLTLVQVSNILIDVYEDNFSNFSPAVMRFFRILENRVKEEVELAKELASLEGMLSLILASSAVEDDLKAVSGLPIYHKPSQNAEKNFIINVL